MNIPKSLSIMNIDNYSTNSSPVSTGKHSPLNDSFKDNSNESCNKNNVIYSHIDEDIRVEKNTFGEETYIFDPYNPLNKEITESEIRNIIKNYGINAPIHNINLYKRAFIHRSYIRRPMSENALNNITIAEKPDNCLRLFTKSNERLEFVGDGVLECITKYYLYMRFPKENEGFMTEKKIALVKNEAIGKIAYEMGLHKWFILSKHAESKFTRTNLKKLGCLFEAFIGAMFLDFNKISVKDEDQWFKNMFITGPGFQMVQIFVQSVFEKHVNWIDLIKNDDNYKNILQVKIQKEFKVTPHYIEMNEHNAETGFHMGVFLCLGQAIYETNNTQGIYVLKFNNYTEIHEYMSLHGKIFVFLGEGKHKIKKKAEQIACENAIHNLSNFD
jgi:dsRNA-specific ribonuclease